MLFSHHLLKNAAKEQVRLHSLVKNTVKKDRTPIARTNDTQSAFESCKRPVPTSHHCSALAFVSGDLLNASHEFLKIDQIRKSLEPPYAGPYKVLSRTSKVFTVGVDSRPVKVSIDELKAADVFPDEVAFWISSLIPTCRS
ncbi:hypothetical protein AVEN_104148-1 [Araneus ventricosus]|uniref:Uncharacterized protein n=1 Tax=Araneus ventricosus TaxID=182803 RepID=A0A4Y2M4W9_ARAVE|nr:hypothetical protein AVEN_104148-1 [Araneus ventricosus]